MSEPGKNDFCYTTPVVLVGGGEVQLDVVTELSGSGWPIIAADGGAEILREADHLPDVIIGDLDSIADAEQWPTGTRVVRIAEQDTTDFEKCLYTVDAPLFVATGFTGTRFDHSLASLHVLHKYVSSRRVILLAGEDLCFVVDGDLSLQLPTGSRFSIFPLCTTQFIRSAGLKYPLDDLRMSCGEFIGTSNEVTDECVRLDVKAGVYSVILPSRLLKQVLDQSNL